MTAVKKPRTKTTKRKPKPRRVRYYDLDGAPVVWLPGKFPKVAGGAIVYDLERVSMEGTPISKAAYEKLVESQGQ